MTNRLGTHADVILTESVLGRILETADSMLIERPSAGIMLYGAVRSDERGDYTEIMSILSGEPVGLCVASREGGTEPSDTDLVLFVKNIGAGILMKADVYAHQFSFYKVGEGVSDATVLFQE